MFIMSFLSILIALQESTMKSALTFLLLYAVILSVYAKGIPMPEVVDKDNNLPVSTAGNFRLTVE